jgi:XTP/dITP diphosphohydrolase
MRLPKEIILATTNKGKLAEFQAAFLDSPFNLKCIDGLFNCPEDKNTFLGNATQKAQMASEITKAYCLADDSGLCVEALNHEPGIFSARYFGKGEGMQKILDRLNGLDNRKAYFVCALVLTDETGKVLWQTEQKWHGQIAYKAEGDNGFGYDPIFIPEGYNVSVAQLEANLKEKISHRGLAIREFKNWLISYI